jgi:lysozyme
LIVGGYHFFTFCRDGKEQAAHFLAHLRLREGDMPPVVDVEEPGNCLENSDPDRLRHSLGEFNRIVAKATGREPVIYTTQGFYWIYFRKGFGQSPFWIRNLLWCPDAGGRAPLCQYEVSKIPGAAQGPVDRNVFRGSDGDFERFLYRPGSHAKNRSLEPEAMGSL